MEEEYCFGHPTLQKHHSVKCRCLNLLVCLIQSCGAKNRKISESTIDKDMKF